MVSQVLAIDGSEMDKKLTLQSKGNDFKIFPWWLTAFDVFKPVLFLFSYLSSSRVKIEKNKLHLIHVESWHNAVFQCVAENDQGMNVSSVWVEVEGKYNILPLVSSVL